MSATSRLASRAAWFGGALATTLVILGGFALVGGDVKLSTLTGALSSARHSAASITPTGGGATVTTSASASTVASAGVDPQASLSSVASAGASRNPDPTTASRSTPSRSQLPSGSAPATTTAAAGGDAALAQPVLDQINAARATAKVPALTMSAGLVRSATAHTMVMVGGCGLTHQCSGEADLGKRITAAGVTWTAAGENIGEGGPEPATPAGIVAMAQQLTADMLAETPPNDGHRKNILSTSFKHVGISLYRDSKGTVWMTQDFSS
jgi:uncharacterized protein YkwD